VCTTSKSIPGKSHSSYNEGYILYWKWLSSRLSFTDVSKDLAASIIRQAVSTSGTSTDFYKTARRNMPEGSHLHTTAASTWNLTFYVRDPFFCAETRFLESLSGFILTSCRGGVLSGRSASKLNSPKCLQCNSTSLSIACSWNDLYYRWKRGDWTASYSSVITAHACQHQHWQ
jgi:hypothetical protein